MSIIVGSARIDERNKATGGTVGDQTGKEVAIENFYTHSKGWYVLRPKSSDVANKIAEAMKQACDNNNIGYDQSNRTGVVTNVKKYGTMKKINVKTEADCSSLVRACIWQATGKDVGNFTTANQANVLEKSGLFEKRMSVSSSNDVYNGDVLVTKKQGHTVVVVSGRPRKSTSSVSSTNNSTSTKKVTATKSASKYDKRLSGTYRTTSNLYCRNGAGVGNRSLCLIPKGTDVKCYGYYSLSGRVKWLYIQFTLKGVQYTGFSSIKYLKKV